MEFTRDDLFSIRHETFPSNSYVLKSEHNSDCLVFDPGLDSHKILACLEENSLNPIAIIATHGHFDHIAGAFEISKNFAIPYYLHSADYKLAKSANFYMRMAKIKSNFRFLEPSHLLDGENGIIRINDFEIEYYNLPGHSYGSCIYSYKNYLITGDIIYKNGLGFNNFPGEDKVLLKKSILKIRDLFSNDKIVFPGHGNFASLKWIFENNDDLNNFLNN